MSNTGYKWIYKVNIPKLKDPIRYRVCVYYGSKNVELGSFRFLDVALKIRNRFIRDNGINEEIVERYNRKENGDKSKTKI